MRPGDLPVLADLLREQNGRDATSYAMPAVFDAEGKLLPRIAMALVAVDEDGRVLQGHVWEKTVEHTVYGMSARATACSIREQEAVFYLLRKRGYEDEHVLVPRVRVGAMRHGLEHLLGLSTTDGELEHFYRRLDADENEDLRRWYSERGERHEPRTTGTGI
jgi:hypothetical protein